MAHQDKISIDLGLPNPFGDESVTELHQKRYLRYFRNAPGPVLEIGCGRGAMLNLLKDAGIPAYGLDSSEDAVTLCARKGLDVVHGEAVGHIQGLEKASLGGIFCAHVIEHLEPGKALALIQECHRAMKPGGTLILITPNAKDLRTTERFWLDTTHVRLYPEKLLVALLKGEGYREITVKEDKEPGKNIFERMLKYFLRLWFMGFMFRGDLVVIAKR